MRFSKDKAVCLKQDNNIIIRVLGKVGYKDSMFKNRILTTMQFLFDLEQHSAFSQKYEPVIATSLSLKILIVSSCLSYHYIVMLTPR